MSRILDMETTQKTPKKLGRDIAIGDVIMFFGTPHRITEIRDHSDNPWGLVGWNGDPWRIAKAADDWGITLDPDHRFEVM